MKKTDTSNEKHGNAVLRSVISRAFSYSFLPKWMIDMNKANIELQDEIELTRRKLGKEKTEELIIRFRNEAYRRVGVNHEYMINKLREARHGL